MVSSWGQDLTPPSKCESERKKVGSLIWKWGPKVLFTTSGNGFGTFEKFMIFWIYFLISFSKSPPLPRLIAEELTFLILHLLATLKFGKTEKFGKCIKVPILFVWGCNFTRCRLNNNICLLKKNSKCCRNIYIK